MMHHSLEMWIHSSLKEDFHQRRASSDNDLVNVHLLLSEAMLSPYHNLCLHSEYDSISLAHGV